MAYTSPYQPLRPCEGRYLIHIMASKMKDGRLILPFDIAVGPSAGYAHITYLQTGEWPLVWRIRTATGQVVLQHALQALNESGQSAPITLSDAAGHNLAVDIGQYGGKYLEVRRSYPASTYEVTSDDIRLGAANWAIGTETAVRAAFLAQLSGLPVLCADVHERESPMVDWCAENRIVLLPSIFPAGDYTASDSRIIVDRKANLTELYHNFASSVSRASYETSACHASALGKQLIYIIGTSPDDNVHQLKDLKHWTARHPKIHNELMHGDYLYRQLRRYKAIHPNTDFRFAPNDRLCKMIYDTVCQPTVCEPAQKRQPA